MYSKNNTKENICQGDIFKKFRYITWIEPKGKIISTDVIDIPFFVVLTQACDLEQDFEERSKGNHKRSDKIINSLLVCPAYLAEELREGIHLKPLKIDRINGAVWKNIESNNHKRFHFLKGNDKLAIPDLVLDFKQYYTLPLEKIYGLYGAHYFCSIDNMFKENLSQRFANYLSRIGLPNLKKE